MDKHPLIQQYLSSVCMQIRARELHKEIRQEMAVHLEELVGCKREEGADEETAVRWALEQMGDPETVGAGLNRVHKPRIAWGLIGGLAALLIISLVAMYAVGLSYAAVPNGPFNGYHFLQNKMVFTFLGLGVAAVLVFFDYRKLRAYSLMIYTGAVLVTFLTMAYGHQVNGVRGYLYIAGFGMDWTTVSVFVFILCAAGMMLDKEKSLKAWCVQQLLFVAVPAGLYLGANSFSSLFLYTSAYLILSYYIRRSWKELIPVVSSGALFFLNFLFSKDYAMERLTAFLDRGSDPLGAGYMYIRVDEAVRSAGWWGHGFAAVNTRLPMIHTDTLFTYLIYSLGWLAGGAIVLCIVLLLVQMVSIVLEVKDPYGKGLVAGLAALFAVQFVWSIGMSVGMLPIMGISLPLIGYGGSQLLIHMAALGLMLSVYRRKDMIRVPARR
ncbi:FtsW/RodA/SpoVE family cell cycle protein [Paenibacillus sp. TAB 01]|uniref:FtsW/RodA/SpoVE family cell cycle protein n=1 Tax=Paenibacillus sp. TAB 01 TaxID=3368988 RepID=UPI003750C3EA